MEHATFVDPINEPHQSDAFIRAYAKKQLAALNRDLDALREQIDFWRIACSSAEAYKAGLEAALAEVEAQLREAQRAQAAAEHARDLECAKRMLKEKQTKRFKGKTLAAWKQMAEDAHEQYQELLDKKKPSFLEAKEERMLYEERCKTVCAVLEEHMQSVEVSL